MQAMSPNDDGRKVITLPSMKGGVEMQVALTIAAGVGILYMLRKGMKGIGDFQLTGSTVGAVEWAAYAAVVGGTFRVLQANFPESKVVQALAFVY